MTVHSARYYSEHQKRNSSVVIFGTFRRNCSMLMDPIPPGGLSAMDTHVHGDHNNTHVEHVSNGHLHGHPHHPHHAQHVQVDHDPQDLHEEEREVK